MSFTIQKATRQGVQGVVIPLSRGLLAFVDEQDAPAILKHKWYADKARRSFYAIRVSGRTKIYMHREILGFPSERVDHRDRNGLNNRRSNLRLSTGSQNSANGVKKGWSSQYKGVGWDSQRGQWRAQIKVNYKGRFLGRFDTQEEAAKAYDRAALEAWGEFALTNFGGKP